VPVEIDLQPYSLNAQAGAVHIISSAADEAGISQPAWSSVGGNLLPRKSLTLNGPVFGEQIRADKTDSSFTAIIHLAAIVINSR
jgi:hypothetical protein